MYRVGTFVSSAVKPASVATLRTLAQRGCERTLRTKLQQNPVVYKQFMRNYAAPVASEPFLNGSSSTYVEEMYSAWLQDPNSVHKVRAACGMCHDLMRGHKR